MEGLKSSKEATCCHFAVLPICRSDLTFIAVFRHERQKIQLLILRDDCNARLVGRLAHHCRSLPECTATLCENKIPEPSSSSCCVALERAPRWLMARGFLRLLVSARNWVRGTALPVEIVGSNQNVHGERRAELVGGKSPPL